MPANTVAQEAPASRPPATLTADDFAVAVRAVYDTMLSRSPDPFRAFPRDVFEAELERFQKRKSPIGEAEAFVEVGKFLGRMRDGHSWVSLDADTELFSRAVPLRFWKFSDGLYVRAAAPELEELVGARVLGVDGVPVEEAWDRMHDAVGGGGRIATARAQVYFEIPEFLAAVGLAKDRDAARFDFRLVDGRRVERTVRAVPYETYDAVWQASHKWETPAGWIEPPGADSAAWFGRRDEAFWFEVLPGSETLYLAGNQSTYDRDNPWNPEKDDFRPFLNEAFSVAAERGVRRIVIDLRNNNGGFTSLWQPLVHHLIRSDEARQGLLFVVIGRLTESAAVAWAAKIETNTAAVFVGEPTASPPNFYNDFAGGRRPKYDVPGTALNFRVANSVEQWSAPWDDRRAIYPDVPTPLSYADFAAGRDPALRAILEVTPDEAAGFRVDEKGVSLDETYGEDAFWANPGRRSQVGAQQEDPK